MIDVVLALILIVLLLAVNSAVSDSTLTPKQKLTARLSLLLVLPLILAVRVFLVSPMIDRDPESSWATILPYALTTLGLFYILEKVLRPIRT